MFPRPGSIELVLSIAAAILVINGQWRVGQVERNRRIDLGDGQHAFALRRFLIKSHCFGWSVNDLNSSLPSSFQEWRHLFGKAVDPLRGASAPVFVPHVADDDCGL